MNENQRKIIKDYQRSVRLTLRDTKLQIKNTEEDIESLKKDIKIMKIILFAAPPVIFGAAYSIIKLGLIASGISTFDPDFLAIVGVISVAYEPMVAATMCHDIMLKKDNEEKIEPLANKLGRCEEILGSINQTLENDKSFPKDYMFRYDPNVEMYRNRSREVEQEKDAKVRRRTTT